MRTAAWIIGLCFGLVLAALSILAAGGGHGSYVLLGLVSAPCCAFGIAPAIVLTPALWLGAGPLAGRAADKTAARTFLVVMGTHVLGATIALSVRPYADWAYVRRTHADLIAGSLVYAIAQCYVWGVFLYTKARAATPAN